MSTNGSQTGEPVDVAIVGFGPVGVVLGALLAKRGLRVVALDRDTELFPLPRAAHLDHEVLRIVQELGCADELVAAMRPNRGMDFLTADHRPLLEMRTATTTPSGWPSSMFFHQPGFETRLRRAAVELGVETRLGIEVTSVQQHQDVVALGLGDGTTLDARWVVGCDGARSTVRRLIGATLDDLQFEEPWLVVDLVLQDPVPRLPAHALQVCDPARPHTLVPMPEPRFRFEFMLLPGEDPSDVQRSEVVEALVAPWLDPGTAVLERSAVYTFHGLIATPWRDRRVLLAGDAAHQMPPFLGQGMCSGLRDAANLAWKLAAVAHGDAPDTLLDTYQAEREPHVRAIVEAAVGFGRIICTTDPEVAAARDEAMLARRAGAGPDDGTSAETSSSPPLAPGPLVLDGGGVQSVQPVVDGQRLDDYVGPRWLVVGRDRVDGGVAEWWRSAGALVLLVDSHPELAALLGDDDVVVVRPDRYVLGRGSRLEDLTDPVRSLVGAG